MRIIGFMRCTGLIRREGGSLFGLKPVPNAADSPCRINIFYKNMKINMKIMDGSAR